MVFACWKVHFPSVNILKAGAILTGLVFNEKNLQKYLLGTTMRVDPPLQGTVHLIWWFDLMIWPKSGMIWFDPALTYEDSSNQDELLSWWSRYIEWVGLANMGTRSSHQVVEHRCSWQDDRQHETQQEARDAMSALIWFDKSFEYMIWLEIWFV